MDQDIGLFVGGFGILSLLAIGVGIGARLGYFRSWYLFKGFPGYPSGYIYGAISAGIGGLLAVLAFLFLGGEQVKFAVVYGLGGLMLLSFILVAWKPRFLKPWWLKWLEDHYGHVLEDMLEAARSENDFEQQTRTKADLATWADSVAEKHGWQRLNEKR